jgi:hypothetical protein
LTTNILQLIMIKLAQICCFKHILHNRRIGRR